MTDQTCQLPEANKRTFETLQEGMRQNREGGSIMTAHSDKRRDKARTIAHESGISVRQAYRRLRNIEVNAEIENFDYEAETPKGEWI